ncbi:restriction endonuclease subunit S [Thermodesulfovibrio yellowstonii]|uniref:restriction endonuclease subunit S n=1 Tax=Thermodesulfovibrio yellowstonii TaxID=28262 RepID=UPI000409DABC|nr:restriction endonuclease subunit S [Thermodesulfovibrio islandicus]
MKNNWLYKKLGEICEVVMGQSPSSAYYNVEKNGLPFYQGKAEFGDIYPTPRKWCTKPLKIAEENDILISVRAPVGPVNICKETSCIGRGLAAIRYPFRDSHKFIFYYLRSIESKISKIGTGSTFSAISKSQIPNLKSQIPNLIIPLPPLNEQKRIVAKIEELFTRLEAGVEALKKVKAQIRRYRQAVLKYAFEGKLTNSSSCHSEQRSGEGISENAMQSSVANNDLPELPEGWRWVKLGEAAEIIMGQSPPSKTYNTVRIGLPFYQGKAEFGLIYPIPSKWCSKPKKIAEKNDILLSIRAPVGPTNICFETSCIGRGLAAIRFGGLYKFLFYYLRNVEREISKIGTGSTFSAISKSQISNLKSQISNLKSQIYLSPSPLSPSSIRLFQR